MRPEAGDVVVLLLGEVVLDQLVALGVHLGLVHLGELVRDRPRYSPKNVRYTQRVMYAAVMNAPIAPTTTNAW